MPARRALMLAVLAVAAPLCLPAPPVHAASKQQALFRELLLKDRGTSNAIRTLLKRREAFVDRTVRFGDVTSDKRADAIVTVRTSGAAGVVAAYVFSSVGDTSSEPPLRVIFRSQRLYRGSAFIRRGRNLVTRTAAFAEGDDLCCPAATLEKEFRWSTKRKRFAGAGTREIPRAQTAEPGADATTG